MEKQHWFESIRYRVPAIVGLTILIPMLAFLFYTYQSARENILENARHSLYTSLYGSSLLMESSMEEVRSFSKDLSRESDLTDKITAYLSEPSERAQKELSLALGQYAGEMRTLDQIYLVFEKSDLILSTDFDHKTISIKEGLGEKLYQLDQNYFSGRIEWYSLPVNEAQNDWRLAHIRPVPIPEQYGGCTMICTLKEKLDSTAGTLDYPGVLSAVTDYQGRILEASWELEHFSENLKEHPLFQDAYQQNGNTESYIVGDEKPYLVMYYNSVESGWKYLGAVPLSEILDNFSSQAPGFLLIVVLGVFSILLGSGLLYIGVVQPLNRLMRGMKRMEEGELAPLTNIKQKGEIGAVLHSYNRMTEKLRQLIDEVYVQQLLRKQAQLSSLQSQMDEHFLYNTINTIYCEACREKAGKSANMLIVLSQYFRLSLAKGQDMVGLDEIVELIRCYLKIQKMRFGDALRCRIEDFPDMNQYVALKYLFQPIVENAIVHGFEPSRSSHTVEIVFRKEEEFLYFEVKDDGAGMPEETRRQLMEESGNLKTVGNGYALKNIREQIRITYGEEYPIFIESREGEGIKVYFRIPLKRRNDDET